jgi:hypothetical protein
MAWTVDEKPNAPAPAMPKLPLTIISNNIPYTFDVGPDSDLDGENGIFAQVIRRANTDSNNSSYKRIQKVEFFDEQKEMITPSNLPQKGSFAGRTFVMKVSQHTSGWTGKGFSK